MSILILIGIVSAGVLVLGCGIWVGYALAKSLLKRD
jgi:hypothetical protein